MFQFCASCCGKNRKDGLYEPLLADREREAVSDLLSFLEHRQDVNFYTGEPLQCLSTLVFSENVDLQRSAALAFAEITEKGICNASRAQADSEDVRAVEDAALEPILYLLQIDDVEVLRAASAALGNLAVDNENKVAIVRLGGLEILIQHMTSKNVEVQCNAVGCITNLATHDENKQRIARSGALQPLTKLARSDDMRVQRNATGALLNMTHSDENRAQLVNAGAMPILVSLLNSSDTDVQYYCTTALSNVAVDAVNRRKLMQSEPNLVPALVSLMDSSSGKVQCQAALALRNLASDEKYQLEVVRANGLAPLLRLLKSPHLPLNLSSVACIRNISIHPLNEAPIIDAGFLRPLVALLSFTENEELQCHAISTLRNLAASSEKNKRAIVEAGSVQKCMEMLLHVPVSVQSEMTACIAVLALSEELKSVLLSFGVCEVLLPLTQSPSSEIQGNSAAALGNLSSRVEDHSAFIKCWTEPAGGMCNYLTSFLSSPDATFQHIAVWTVLQLLESDDDDMISLIKSSDELVSGLERLANTSESQAKDDESDPEIAALSERSLELLNF